MSTSSRESKSREVFYRVFDRLTLRMASSIYMKIENTVIWFTAIPYRQGRNYDVTFTAPPVPPLSSFLKTVSLLQILDRDGKSLRQGRLHLDAVSYIINQSCSRKQELSHMNTSLSLTVSRPQLPLGKTRIACLFSLYSNPTRLPFQTHVMGFCSFLSKLTG